MADKTLLLLYLMGALTLLAVLSLGIYLFLGSEAERASVRLREVTQSLKPEDDTAPAPGLQAIFVRPTAWLGSRLGLRMDEPLQQRMVSAGLKGTLPKDLYQASRILGPLLALLAGSMVPYARAFWMIALPAVAYLAPELVLAHLVRRRRDCIRRSIPDVIDLLVICVDAGLGLDQAMLRVGQELSISHPETNDEILIINHEQRAGKTRADAWQAMADRVKIPEIDAMVNMLMQTERFGTPIAKALTTFTDGVRLKRRQAAEEMAAKSTVKIIFPLVFFIFPALFIVLLGPAALNIMRVMKGQQ